MRDGSQPEAQAVSPPDRQRTALNEGVSLLRSRPASTTAPMSPVHPSRAGMGMGHVDGARLSYPGSSTEPRVLRRGWNSGATTHHCNGREEQLEQRPKSWE